MSLEFVYITNPNKKHASKIARHLLKKRLIACANIMPIESMYWWKNKIANEKEFLLIGKTKAKNFKLIKREVEKIHRYETPCIASFKVRVNKKFGEWLKKELK